MRDPALIGLRRALDGAKASINCTVSYSGLGSRNVRTIFVIDVPADRAAALQEALKSEQLGSIVAEVRYETPPDFPASPTVAPKDDGKPEKPDRGNKPVKLQGIFERAVSAAVNKVPDQTLFERGTAAAVGLGGLAIGGMMANPLLAVFGMVAGAWYGAKMAPTLWLRYRQTPSP